jgi:hypothetical protein
MSGRFALCVSFMMLNRSGASYDSQRYSKALLHFATQFAAQNFANI